MPRIHPKPGPGTPFGRIMAHRPQIHRDWNALDEGMRFAGLLEPELKEEVRRALAQVSGCAFCASLGQSASSHPDRRTAVAVHFARQAAVHPTGVDDATFDALRSCFGEQEIVELVAWVALMYASEMLGAMLKLAPATPDQVAAYSRWLQRGFAKYHRDATTPSSSQPASPG